MKAANGSTKLSETAQRAKPGDLHNIEGKNKRDARGKPGKQEENQRELGVDDTHRTEDMKRGKRGSFP
jgi:hypothetical protein